MSEKIVISVKPAGGEPLNGLGMMMLQYLEQNFQDFETKRRQALSLNSSVTVEADKGIAVTVTFGGREIQIQNGTSPQVDLHLQGSFIDLSKILTGRSSPLKELLTRRVRLKTWPRKPIQCLKILKLLKVPANFSPHSPE